MSVGYEGETGVEAKNSMKRLDQRPVLLIFESLLALDESHRARMVKIHEPHQSH